MTRVLVVDDMAIFREAIAAALRRDGYETLGAADGREALSQIRRHRPDLVLLDLGMPVMDGLTCLTEIRGDPEIRDTPVIILTALAERDPVKQAAQVGVQGYLLKSQFSLDQMLARVREVAAAAKGGSPAMAEPERCADDKSGASVSRRATPESRAAAAALGPESAPVSLPSMKRSHVLKRIEGELELRAIPPVLHHVSSMANSSRSSIDEIAGAVRQDPALAVKVMRVANSSFFGSGKTAQTLSEATQRIGMSGIRNTVTAIMTIEYFDRESIGGLNLQRFWEHSLSTAALAEALGHAVGAKDAEKLFLAGLLHDIGRVVLGTVFPEEHEAVLAYSAREKIDLAGVERKAFGLSHADVTKSLLAHWEMPEEVVEAAAVHERAVDLIERTTRDPQGALVVAFADRLSHALALGDSGNPVLRPLGEYREKLGLDASAVRPIWQDVIRKAQETEFFYASQVEERFREPLTRELSARAEEPMKVAVCSGHAPDDALSLFFEQVGWLDPAEARVAILGVSTEPELKARFAELHELEAASGGESALLIVSPKGSIAPPDDLRGERPFATASLPCRYNDLVEAVVRLDGAPAHAG